MDPLKFPKTNEADIQKRIIKLLTLKGWYTKVTHGNALQKGLPDIFACHSSYGSRWIEIKRPVGGRYTSAQLTVFKSFASKNIGVWLLTGEHDYDRLFGPPNWHSLLFSSRGLTIKDAVQLPPRYGPEAVIQSSIISSLTAKDWFCLETFGSLYQSGLPDLYVCSSIYGARWIEVKNPAGYKFTPAQIKTFPRFMSEGVGVWILTSSSPEELAKIHGPPNWFHYLKD